MADAGLFIGWGNPVRGRERKAIEVFGEAVGLWTRLQGEGKIEGFDAVFLEPHGGDLGGFFLLRGDAEALAQVRTSEEFFRVITRADLVVEGMGVVGAWTGAAIQEQMALYEAQLADLA